MDAQLIVFVLAVSAVRNTLSPDHLGSLCYAFRSLIQCQLKQEALDSPPSHFPLSFYSALFFLAYYV